MVTAARELIGQQAPPPGGYSIELFESYLDGMAKRLEAFRATKDHRAVFELTYLVFSRQVLDALKAKRFEDMAWATDMACRFIEVYRHQLERWDRRDPALCRAWRVAFEAMEEGRVHAIQAMLLGINAHIHYDLAFVSLGSSRHLGDLDDDTPTTVPAVRYRDFLVINQLEWEAIALIQDVVLEENSRLLYWANRLTMRFTKFMGQRILMEARDSSWYQTTLLIHAQDDEERAIVTRLIDAYAASIADLIQAVSHRPTEVADNIVGWLRRGDRIDPELQAGLVGIACKNPKIAELALRELAFGGGDAISVLLALIAHGDLRLVGAYGRMAMTLSPTRRRRRLEHFLERGSPPAIVVLGAMIEAGVPVKTLPKASVETVRAGWLAGLQRNLACVALPEVAQHATLVAAIVDDTSELRVRLARLGVPPTHKAGAADVSLVLSREEVLRAITEHADPWIRMCGGLLAAPNETGADMALAIERVLFLKETQIFQDVDISALVYVAEQLQKRSFKTGDVFVRESARSGGIFLITSGQVEVVQVRAAGEVSIARLGPGKTVGDLSALNDTPATADCRVSSDTECLFLPTDTLIDLMHQHPRLAIGLIRMLSQRLMSTTRLVSRKTGGRRASDEHAS